MRYRKARSKGRLKRLALWNSTTLKLLGTVELILALFMLITSVIAYALDEPVKPFLQPAVPLLVLGALQSVLFGKSKNFRAINGLVVVAESWIMVFAIGMIPYVMSGMSPIDAMFESISGFTTTGMSIMSEVESWPMSVLFWRSLTQWIGGIAVIIIFMYILPMLGMGRTFFYNELSGSGSSDYSVRMRSAAKSFVVVYGILSMINLLLLLVCGVEPMEAMCLMFSTISTGGLMCTNYSLVEYSDWIHIITIVFMFLGCTNFYLHYRAIYRHNKRVYRSNSEFKSMTFWFVLISVIVYLILINHIVNTGVGLGDITLEEHFENFKNALFTVVSLGSTTGFYVDEYNMWPAQATILLMLVAFFGGSSGSTSGGVKIGRLSVIYLFLKNSLGRVMRSNVVTNVKIDGEAVEDSAVLSAVAVFLMYMITLIVGSVLLMLYGHETVDSFGLTIAAIGNGGLGFGNYGAFDDLSTLDPAVKIILSMLMWIGRLEILTALVFFTPGFWRELWLNRRANRRLRADH